MVNKNSFLDQASPRIFTIPSGEDFQMVLAKGILAASKENPDPFALHDTIVLTPTRRSVRSLSAAFLQLTGDNKAVLLPQILPIGDVDADEPPFIAGHIPLDIAPEISSNARVFSLARIVMHRAKISKQPVSLTAALTEASAIASLLDTAAHEGIDDFSFATEEFQTFLQGQPQHIQNAARFLEIINTYWPQELRDLGLIDPALRRSKMLDALSEQWTKNPTHKNVIAAGSTGSQKATANLLRVVSKLPNGCVVLPGLDQDLDNKAWDQVAKSPGHPQFGMNKLLRRLSATRDTIQLWPQVNVDLGLKRRRRIINEALTPADITSDWLNRLAEIGRTFEMNIEQLMHDALDGLSLIEAETQDEEALVIALAIRETLEHPTKTAMLVTPDRALARRVRAALQRWSIDIDDSAGVPLSEDATGIYIRLVLSLWADPADPAALLALLVHPLSGLGGDRKQILPLIRQMEINFLRGIRKHQDLSHLIEIIQKSQHTNKQQIADLLQYLHDTFQTAEISKKASFSEFASLHAKLVENLAATETLSGDQALWRGKNGEMASSLFRSLIEDSKPIEEISFDEYARCFKVFAEQVSVRPQQPKGGRIRILGPLEARQQSADLILLSGLDEGVWPAITKANPFLSRNLIKQIKLPDPEQRLGLSAHDFCELACKQQVIMTRAARRDGSPTIASRWIWRLNTLTDAAIGDVARKELLRPNTDYLKIARAIWQIEQFHPAKQPEPKPPLSQRPEELSVTRIKVLIRNPFAIYGQKILGLFALDDVGKAPGASERGTAIHRALELWAGHAPSGTLEQKTDKLSGSIIEQLLLAGFDPSDMAIEAPVSERIAKAFLQWEQQRQQDGFTLAATEKKGCLDIFLKKGQRIKITATSDRIDSFGNMWAVVDYKTGGAPSSKEVLAGWDPQLPLTGAIIHGGGFAEHKIKSGEITELAYLKLSGGEKTLDHVTIKLGKNGFASIQELAEVELDRVTKLFQTFADPETAYLCQPRSKYTDDYSDYDHLARRAEWSAVNDGEG